MRRRRTGEEDVVFVVRVRSKMASLLKCWITVVTLTGVSWCEAVQVSVRDERRFAMLFQSVVLPCQYSSVSTQSPVVQWWYKSYCRDRTRDSFSFPDHVGLRTSELGSSSHLDCGDSGRTVRIVASAQGSSVTLPEYYKGRDISIINRADLRIGQLQWGDSGVYYCKVVIADDPEGQNEAYVELLVLGQTGVAEDLLPDFDLEIMPEWVFVGAVVLGSILFILLVGVCWCQCCPHSCCCYVRCCCCPDTCCCPRHLYEAGKGIKSTATTPVALYPPYYVPGMPTMVPIAPPSLIDPKMSAAPSIENNASAVYRVQPTPDQNSLKVLQLVERELAHFNPSKTSSHDSCSMSELSSLHEAEPDFRQTYRQVQKKALPAIPDLDDPPDLLTREISPVHVQRSARHLHRGNRAEEDHPRWNPRSEHLHRKAFQMGGRTGSLDELEQFAMTYMQQGRHGDFDEDDYRPRLQPRPRPRERSHEYEQERDRDREWQRERELERDRYLYYSSKRQYPKDSPERLRVKPRPPSPPPLPANGKRRGTWESDRPIPRRDRGGRDRTGTRDSESGPDYDDALLSSLLERKAKAGRSASSKGGRGEDDSDTPSKTSSKKSGHSRTASSSRSPGEDSLPPYSEREMERSKGRCETTQRPFTYARPAPSSQTGQEGREDTNRPRKVTFFDEQNTPVDSDRGFSVTVQFVPRFDCRK